MPDDTPVVVIGAGIGGLVAAIELAVAGYPVRIFEAAETVGGKARLQYVDGHAVNAGPTVFTLPDIFEDTLARAGTSLADEIELRQAEVLARHAWVDGSRLDLFADTERSIEAIAAFAGSDEAAGFRRFRADAERARALLEGPFLRAAEPSTWRLVRSHGPSALAQLARINPYASLWTALGRYFRDPRLRQLFGRYATYTGADPFRASASLMLIADVEQRGVWQVDGGMHALAEMLADVARRWGVSIECNTPVATIDCDDHDRVVGLRLADTRHVATRRVISNVDTHALTEGRFGAAARRSLDNRRRMPALSGVTWCVVARTDGFPLSHHNVFFGNDYAAEFTDLFDRRRLPADPTVYVCAQDRPATEHATAPPDTERLLCLANAPGTGADGLGPTDDAHDAFQERVFGVLRRAGLRITSRVTPVSTGPGDFARRFPGSRGALYGPPAHGARAPFARPTARSRLAGLYLAGGDVHPGAGLPMVALSGQNAAHALMADEG
ncbi:1-hydroxycarotenoid 3,4-desaturase CrtD [Salinisphaera sp. Q1T1-3]|uniref:1-hydroxycarotenoid 3,4-desaturase CrtD n=1 Tax=Salinisphaera sp. Q1T1-3 TaxID=2321229 RepID=UPI000E750DD5|nr:1-hydroxycarotenoid 3,4-desaturase CrtD [Salinisphaera sp. Q1T1-3]RJS92101.1 phytoene desaturase [Salinisphaera sp. Q1T1-3]